jgi:hypothetical protein
MARQNINIGSSANDGTGDPLRTAFDKINDNFIELYGTDNDINTLDANLDVNNFAITTGVTNGDITVTPNGTGNINLGSITINGSEVSSSDSTQITVKEGMLITGATTLSTSLKIGTGPTVTAILDEDAMGSDSATALATQQSIKAYVDTAILSPRIGDLSVVGSTITAPSNGDLILQTSGTGTVKILEDKISLGNQAGETAQGDWGIAVGYQAGRDTQGDYGVAIGREAGEVTQGAESIAIGRQAGYDQGDYAVHIGSFAGGGTSGTSGVGSIGLGKGAGTNNAGQYAIAIGYDSQYDGSANNSIAIGKEASKAGGGSDSIAIGYNAMLSNGTAAYTTAIGYEAARSNSVGGGSDRAIAIGYRAGYATLHPNSIVLNAENAALNTVLGSRFYVAPIRNASGTTVLQYDSSSKEITYSANPSISGTLTTADITTVGNQTISGSLTTGTLNVGDLNINADGKISTDTNGNIDLDPSGTGAINLTGPTNVTGTATVTGQLNVDNLRMDANTISSTSGGVTITAPAGQNVEVGGTNVKLTATEANFTLMEATTLRADTIQNDTSDGDISISTQGTGVIDLNTATQTTVGSAGGANALPATPTGYIKIKIAGTMRVIPFYDEA